MKALKGLLFLSLFFLLSCSDDNVADTIPKDIEVNGVLDIGALGSLVGTDATALVTFGGVSAATYLSEVIPGDKLEYEITVPTANTEIRIIDYRFNLTGSTASGIDWDENFYSDIDTISNPAYAYIQVNTNAPDSEDEYKFDIDFKVYVNGVSNHVVYSTDPKIKIRSRR